MTNPVARGAPARRRGAIVEPVAVQLLNNFRDEKEGYLDVLWVDLNGNACPGCPIRRTLGTCRR